MGPLEIVAARLSDAGVPLLFGMPGGGSNLDLIQAASLAGIRFVLTATETGAALAAIAQSEISGRPGACLTTLGPGVASVVNGVACAQLERAPLLVFTDGHPSASGGTFEHQRLDHRALLAPVTKWSATLSARNAEELMREAIDRATAAPPGPVHVECPADVDRSLDELPSRPATSAAARRQASPPVDAAALAPFLARARKPLLLVGLGARRPVDAVAIRDVCAAHNLPAMVTYKAKGVVPDTSPHFAGIFTNAAIEQPIVADADLLVGVGLDPVELLPRAWTHAQPVVNIGPWAVGSRHVPFAAEVVTDIPSGMQRVGELIARSEWDIDATHRRFVEQCRRLSPASTRLVAHRVVQVAADAAARARVTVDAGAHMFPATMLWPVSDPNGMLISNGLSTMGFALPAAIGAALFERDGARGAVHGRGNPVVALTGDGGLLMCAGELVTAVREQLHIITIVFSDASLSLIEVKQRQRGLTPAGVSLGAISWCALAAGAGAAAHLVRTEPELERALMVALDHRGPSVIEAEIDSSSYAETLRTVRG